ncbi:MAG: heat-shock protein Hsp20 [Methylobacter sp.]|nr:MAG: heat-shock protein Hsp20 [Methylobacter sp.]
MSTNENEPKKSTEIAPQATGGLFSFDEFDSFFDEFLSRRWPPRLVDWNFPGTPEKNFPKVDIIDHDNEIEIQAALPGVKKEDLEVSINNQTLTIRTSTKEEKKEEGKYFRREITRGEYQRTLSLPNNVDNENTSATFNDGILKVVIPKTATSKRKNIEIK